MPVAVVAEKPSVARDIAQVLGARTARRGLPARQRLRRHLGDRPPRGARRSRTRSAPSGSAGGARTCRCCPTSWPLVVAARHARPVRGRGAVLARPRGRARRVRDRRGARGRADLPLHLRGRRLPQAGEAAVDLVAHARGDPRRASRALRAGAELRSPGRRRARPQPRRLARRHEPLARLHASRHDETLSVGRVQTPDAGDARRARARDPRASCPRTTSRWWPRSTPARDARPLPRARGSAPPSAPTRRGRSGCPPDGEEAGRDRRARARAGRAEVESVERRDAPASRRRCSTTSPSCSATPTGSSASAPRRRWTSRRRSTSSRSSSATRAPTAATCRRDVAATLPRRGGDRGALRARCSRRAPASGRSARASSTTRRSPTTTPSSPRRSPPEGLDALPPTSARIYDLVCRRLLTAWHDDHVFSVTTVITRVARPDADPAVDRYHRAGHGGRGGRLEGARARGHEPAPARARGEARTPRAARTTRRRCRPASPRARRSGGRRRGGARSGRGRRALHRRDAAHRDGDGGPDARRERAVRGDAGARPRHAGHARRDHRDAAPARVHRAGGQGRSRATDKGIALIESSTPT